MNTFAASSSWICQFPLSLAVEGPECYSRIADAGIGRVLFCTVIYAPYRLVLPRYPRKGIYSLEEGLYYYRPNLERFRGLPVAPVASVDFRDKDLLAECVKGAQKAGIKPGAWVSVFANGMIAKTHSSWAAQNLYGSADRLFLCFNNPEVREYSLRVCTDMAERYELAEIMLDKFPQLCLELNSLSGRIDPVLRTLGSFCFCPHCVAAAAKGGLDLKACQEKALGLAAQSLAIPPHVVNTLADELKGDTEIPLLLMDHPWILDILRFRIESIRQFIKELRERLSDMRSPASLSACFVPPVKIGHDAASPRSWLGAQSYAAYKASGIDSIHSVIHWGPEVVEYDTRRAVHAVADSPVQIITHLKAYGSARPDDMSALVAAVKRAGSSGIAYFCYDLMTDEMLKAVKGQ